MHFYAITGYVFDLSQNLKFKPAALTKIVSGTPLELDLSANFLWNETFYVGAAYRLDAAISGLLGFQINPSIMLGFAYDKESTDWGSNDINSGSYELFARYELKRKDIKIETPRFF